MPASGTASVFPESRVTVQRHVLVCGGLACGGGSDFSSACLCQCVRALLRGNACTPKLVCVAFCCSIVCSRLSAHQTRHHYPVNRHHSSQSVCHRPQPQVTTSHVPFPLSCSSIKHTVHFHHWSGAGYRPTPRHLPQRRQFPATFLAGSSMTPASCSTRNRCAAVLYCEIYLLKIDEWCGEWPRAHEDRLHDGGGLIMVGSFVSVGGNCTEDPSEFVVITC